MQDILNDPSHPNHLSIVQSLRDSRIAPGGSSLNIEMEPYITNQVYNHIWMGGAPPIRNSIAAYFDCLVLSACEFQVPLCYIGVQV
ncbi:MAG TPA: hypothetical protein VIE65_00755, partial [Methylobacter sp.]